ncbi:MAG: hypothetical protein R8K22_05185, partial [Mariprofundaceae bacterium]
MNYFGLIQFGLLASVGFAVLAALITTMTYPFVRHRLSQMPPELRSNMLLIWLVAPVVIGVSLTALTFMPSFLSLFGFTPDHCTVHDG